jgi:hypothetical protein
MTQPTPVCEHTAPVKGCEHCYNEFVRRMEGRPAPAATSFTEPFQQTGAPLHDMVHRVAEPPAREVKRYTWFQASGHPVQSVYVLASDFDATRADHTRLLAAEREERERITRDRDAKTSRMWELGKQCDQLQQEVEGLRNLANNLQPGPISEALAGERYTREVELQAQLRAAEQRVEGARELFKSIVDNGDECPPFDEIHAWLSPAKGDGNA